MTAVHPAVLAAVIGLSACSIDAKSEDFECATTAECSADRTCEMGYCVLIGATTDGAVVDARGGDLEGTVRVTDSAGDGKEPSLVADAAGFAIAWRDNRDGNNEVYFVRVDANGQLIGAELRVTNDAANSDQVSLTSTGTEYGVAWKDTRDGNDEIYFARISSAGALIGTVLRVTNDLGRQNRPSMVWTGSQYAITWVDNRDGTNEIYVAFVDSSGGKIGTDVRVTTTGSSTEPSASFDGTNIGLAWTDNRDGNSEIYFASLDATTGVASGEVAVTADAARSRQSSLAAVGGAYAVAWNEDRDGSEEIYFAALDLAGTKNGNDVAITAALGKAQRPCLGGDTALVLAWQDERDGNKEIYGADVDSAGVVAVETRITEEPARSERCSAATFGSLQGIAWSEDRDGNDEIYLHIVP